MPLRFVKPESLFVIFDGGTIVPGGIQGVGLLAQGQRQELFALQFFRDKHGCFGKVERLARAHADSLEDQLRELFDHLFANQRLVPRKKSAAGRIAGELTQLCDKGIPRVFPMRSRHQLKPSSSRCARSRSRHFWRVNPMEPTARPSCAATSEEGRDGVSKNSNSTSRRHCGVKTVMASRSICSSCVC